MFGQQNREYVWSTKPGLVLMKSPILLSGTRIDSRARTIRNTLICGPSNVDDILNTLYDEIGRTSELSSVFTDIFVRYYPSYPSTSLDHWITLSLYNGGLHDELRRNHDPLVWSYM